jgi:hypothetical protein
MTRTRTRQLGIRLTLVEYDKLAARAAAAQLPVTRYIIATAVNGKVSFYAPDAAVLARLRTQLKRNGTLLNQIAHGLNKAKYVSGLEDATAQAQAVLAKLEQPELAALDAIDKALAKSLAKEVGQQCPS